jgi:murein DD-endopeptidase MepM/ murein hydrolase activator NlpD
VSRTAGQHRKSPARLAAATHSAAVRRPRRLPAPIRDRGAPERAAIVAVAIVAAITAFSIRIVWPGQTAHAQAGLAVHSRPPPRTVAAAAAPPPLARAAGRPDLAVGARRSLPQRHRRGARRLVYRNPLRAISGLVLERVDMGADFGGSGPVYAIGKAIITRATGHNYGWPGGGWITYQLTAGPARGLQIYVAEDVRPTVGAGEHVTAGTVIGRMYNGGAGIETGWAMPDGLSAESQLPVAGGISGGGPFPTEVGLDFDRLLQALGVRAAPNSHQAGYGILPPFYPSGWASVRSGR